MGFILGVLVIGALLSTIFGRRVGAMFVTGTATVVLLCFGVLLLLLSPLIWDFFHEPSHVGSSDNSYSSPSYRSAYTPPTPASSAPTAYSTQAPAPTAQAASASPPVSGNRSAEYDRAIMVAVDSAMSPPNWQCPTDPQARLQMAEQYRGVADYIRQRVPYADPGKPGLYRDYANECDHVASHLADLSQSLPPSATPLDLSR